VSLHPPEASYHQKVKLPLYQEHNAGMRKMTVQKLFLK